MNERTKPRGRRRLLALAAIVGAIGAVGVAAPANAHFNDYCLSYSNDPYVMYGTQLWTTSYTVCNSPRSVYQTGAHGLYSVSGGIYNALTPMQWAWSSSKTATGSCAGMGTRGFQTEGVGVNDISEQGWSWGGPRALTC